VQLVVDYLFGTKKKHRIHLVIVPENSASRRIAAKCGFTDEGTLRGVFFNDGRNQDVQMYSLLRTDPRPWHEPND
jgi:RimJ/RimL family protein N-acetyltransferase